MNQDLLEKAMSGDAESQYQLALCYRNGEGVEQSNEEAVKWYRKAAEQGNSDAQEALTELEYNKKNKSRK